MQVKVEKYDPLYSLKLSNKAYPLKCLHIFVVILSISHTTQSLCHSKPFLQDLTFAKVLLLNLLAQDYPVWSVSWLCLAETKLYSITFQPSFSLLCDKHKIIHTCFM